MINGKRTPSMFMYISRFDTLSVTVQQSGPPDLIEVLAHQRLWHGITPRSGMSVENRISVRSGKAPVRLQLIMRRLPIRDA